MLKINSKVREKNYGYLGIVKKIYDNWLDLNQQSNGVGGNGYAWLKSQEHIYDNTNLYEHWYLVECFDGGSIWTCESRLKEVKDINN